MELPAEAGTLAGNMVKIEKVDGTIIVGGRKVIMPDIMATNGVIHGIDGVILETTVAIDTTEAPATVTGTMDDLKPIGETLSLDPDFSTLVAAVSSAVPPAGAEPITEVLSPQGPITVGATSLYFTYVVSSTLSYALSLILPLANLTTPPK
jgi:uncharacterized surface protein with fasciclin (FAS1) repeats